MVFGGLATYFRITAGPEPTGQLATNVNLQVSFGKQQRLSVRVGRDELDIFQTRGDHPVNCVRSAPTNANYLDNGVVVALTETHGLPLIISSIVTAPARAAWRTVIEG